MPWRRYRALAIVPLAGGLLALGPHGTTTPLVAHGFTYSQLNTEQQRELSGFAALELNPTIEAAATGGMQPDQYFPRGSNSCSVVLSSNVKVNQNCLNVSDPDLQGRGQAQNETSISQDPNNPNHLVASYNDYRRGDGNCYSAYSLDKARTWNDSTIPMSFTRGRNTFNSPREYWQAGGDTSVAWDSKGNAYLSCQVFNRGGGVSPNQDQSSAFYVFRSTQNNGASWNFPGRPVFEYNDVPGNGLVLEDKQLMTADNNPLACAGLGGSVTPGSTCTAFQDRVYVSWTEFAADGSAYIYEAYSADYGEHFSPRHLVSATSSVCTNTFGAGTPNGPCNENQFSQPFVAPDGTLYVTYANYNNQPTTGTDNRYQVLIAKSLDGGSTFGPPVKVSDFYDLPDCAAYQGGKDAGRSCVPEKGPTTNSIFRATNYPSGAVNPLNPAQVVITFGSYINVHSNEANGCVPAGFSPFGNPLYTGAKTAGACNNDILESISNDAGLSFTGTTGDPRVETSVNQDPGQATTDQFWQWIAFSKNGKLATSYYDRQYGTDETTGFSDVSLSGTGSLTNFVTQRVTSSSMPFPTEFGGVFMGDYTGLTAVDNAYPLWTDTRNPDVFLCAGTGTTTAAPQVCTANSNGIPLNDQDAYTAAQAIPGK